MTHVRRCLLSAAGLALAAASPLAAQDTAAAPMPSMEEAVPLIEALDARMFWAAFEGCEPETVGAILDEDYRMLHDVGGLTIEGRDQFVAGLGQMCAARAQGGANEGYRNRRLLVPGSRTITPLGTWGVLERAWHTFHEWRGEEHGWVQTGGAQYWHVWRWVPEEGQFRLAESLSVDHAPAPAYPPASER